jgi:Ribbon-helix-helix protein
MAAKDSGLRVRVERPLRTAFLEACREQDKPAAQVIREFMRGYVARHTSAKETARTADSGELPRRDRDRVER